MVIPQRIAEYLCRYMYIYIYILYNCRTTNDRRHAQRTFVACKQIGYVTSLWLIYICMRGHIHVFLWHVWFDCVAKRLASVHWARHCVVTSHDVCVSISYINNTRMLNKYEYIYIYTYIHTHKTHHTSVKKEQQQPNICQNECNERKRIFN